MIHDEYGYVRHATRTYPPRVDAVYREVLPPRDDGMRIARRWVIRLFVGTCCALAGAQWGAAVRRERVFETVYRPAPELCEDAGGMWRRCPWASPPPRPSHPDALP